MRGHHVRDWLDPLTSSAPHCAFSLSPYANLPPPLSSPSSTSISLAHAVSPVSPSLSSPTHASSPHWMALSPPPPSEPTVDPRWNRCEYPSLHTSDGSHLRRYITPFTVLMHQLPRPTITLTVLPKLPFSPSLCPLTLTLR